MTTPWSLRGGVAAITGAAGGIGAALARDLAARGMHLAQEDFDWRMAINFEAVVRLSRAFLPLLAREPAAPLVDVSSVFGILAPPGQSAYFAAKFAVRGFSEALRHELAMAGSPVGVTIVHPGGRAHRHRHRDAPRLLIGADARLGERLQRLMPVRYGSVLGAALQARMRRLVRD